MPAGAGLLDSLGPHRTPRRVDGPLTRVRAALLWTSLDRALARGMARLEFLLTDGVGCAYAPAYPGQLVDELEGLGLALEGREEGW
jgi:hypothetical protein